MRRTFSALLSLIDFRDILGIAGFCLLVYGVWLVRREAGFIVAGMLMIAFAISLSRK